MPFSTAQITKAGKATLDNFQRNNPIDQIAVERPLLRMLMAKKRSFGGGKQYIVEQLRKAYNSNFQWYFGDQQVSYNKRDTLAQSFFPWRSCHDGYSLNEDDFFQNGLIVVDSATPQKSTEAERIQLTNLYDENNEVLRLGFEEKLDYELHLDGTQDTEALAGLDYLVPIDPTSGVVGGIDRATNTWWRSYTSTGLASGTLLNALEIGIRTQSRNGGKPNMILAGSDWVDAFRAASTSAISRQVTVSATGQGVSFDPSVGTGNAGTTDTGFRFHMIPIHWDPVMETLDTDLSPATAWEKRGYMLNDKHIRLRPAQGHDMVTRKPPRVYDRYAYYWGLTWKGGLCINRSNCHGVYALT